MYFSKGDKKVFYQQNRVVCLEQKVVSSNPDLEKNICLKKVAVELRQNKIIIKSNTKEE